MNMFRSALLLLLVPFCLAAETLHVYSTTDIHGHIFSNRKNPNLLKLSEAIRNDITGKTISRERFSAPIFSFTARRRWHPGNSSGEQD